MADTNTLSTLNPFSAKPKKEAPLGGKMGFFEDIFETLTGTGQGYTNEGSVSAKDLENFISPAEFKSNFPSSGEISDFQKSKSAEKSDSELLREKREAVAISQEIMAEHRQDQMKDPLTKKREEVNSAIGIGNVSYEDTVNEDGSLRMDVQTYMDRKNSEMAEAEVKTSREAKLVQARGKTANPGTFKMRKGELEMGTENQSHFTRQTG